MIIETAGKILESNNLCDHCLGRLFAKLGRGTNGRGGRRYASSSTWNAPLRGGCPPL